MTKGRYARLAVLLSLVLAVVVAVPVTLAFVIVQTPTIINTFGAADLPPGDATVDVQVVKTVTAASGKSIGPEGFHFLLKNVETGDEHVMTSDANGNALVRLAYYAQELGNTYHYTITEVKGDREGVVYSEQEYSLDVTIVLDAAKRLSTLCTVNGVRVEKIVAEFENLYTETQSGGVPSTGDRMNLWLCVAVLLCCSAMLVVLRRQRKKLM